MLIVHWASSLFRSTFLKATASFFSWTDRSSHWAMTPKSKNKPSEFSREEAKLILDAVSERYRIHQLGRPEETDGKMPLVTPKLEPEEQLSQPMTSGSTAGKRLLAAVRQWEIGPRLDLGWSPYLLDTSEKAHVHLSNEPTRGSARDEDFGKPAGEIGQTEYQDFHYLIRILECSSILHCQVTAESAAAARNQIIRIPNLIDWREISVKELAEIIRIEKEAGRFDER